MNVKYKLWHRGPIKQVVLSACLVLLILYSKYFLKKRLIIIGQRYAQLGNRLTLFAHFIAYVIENDCNVINPAFCDYADYFNNTKEKLFCRYPYKKVFFLSLTKRGK